MKYIKKSFSVLMSILMLTVVFLPILASAASCSVSATSVSGKQGDTVTVNVNISSIALGAFLINLNFDSSKLQVVSATEGSAATALKYNDKPTVSGSEVRCTASTNDIVNTTVSGNIMSVKFKILASSGSTAVTVSGDVVDVSGAKISTSFSGASVSISGGGGQVTPPTPATTAPPTSQINKSSNANLKSLSIQGRTTDGRLVGVAFSPAFSSSIISYNANVLSDISELVITATAEHANATVSISKSYLKMDVGKNTTIITVKAENGATKRYRITTIKAAEGTTPVEATTEATTEGETAQTTVPQEENSTIELSTTVASSTTAQAVDAFGKNILKQVSNDVFIKLSVAFAVAAISFFGASICLFVSDKKRKSNNK